MDDDLNRYRRSRIAIRDSRLWLIVFYLVIFQLSCVASADSPLQVGHFSAEQEHDGYPQGWEALEFKNQKNHTRYSLITDEGTVVVRADSEASSSGLIRKISIDPSVYPIVRWRWKVMNTFAGGDVTKKSGDDYPARLYITFAYDPSEAGFLERLKYNSVKLIYGDYPPAGALNYIWASKAPKGTVTPNPYTDKVMMIVVESGGESIGQWINEARNVVEDYINAFGVRPPRISGVAIMTDTDNTGSSGVAFYGDITFSKK